jgi:uncharacterized Zn-binding protein involved in type VI secretion
MYWRAFIFEGDTTTPAGGRVQPIPQQGPVTRDGKHACFEGDPVYCNACKTWGVTKCVKPYRQHTGPNGRQANLDGDLCICKCPIPPRLKALSDKDHMGFDEDELAEMVGSNAWLVHAGHPSLLNSAEKYGKVFEFKDSETGKPLANRTFIVNENGVIHKSKTDKNGKALIEAIAGHSISIHLVFEAPQGEMNYEA